MKNAPKEHLITDEKYYYSRREIIKKGIRFGVGLMLAAKAPWSWAEGNHEAIKLLKKVHRLGNH